MYAGCRRIVLAATALVFTVGVQAALAQEVRPHLVISLASYNELKSDLRYLGGLFGNPQVADAFEGLILINTRGLGLLAWDRTRRWGAVVELDTELDPDGNVQPKAFLLILPITDMKVFLKMVEGLVGPPEEVARGIYRIPISEEEPAFATQIGRWVVIGPNRLALDKVPADPGQLLAGIGAEYDAAVQMNFGLWPAELQRAVVEKLKEQMTAALVQAPEETDQQFRLRREMTEGFLALIEDGYSEIDQIVWGLNVDRVEGNLNGNLSITIRPQSPANKFLAELTSEPAAWAQITELNPAYLSSFSAKLGSQLAGKLQELLEDARTTAINMVDENDVKDKALLKNLINHTIDVTTKVVEGRSLNGVFAWWSKPGEFGGLLAFRTSDVDAAKRLVRELGRAIESDPEIQAVFDPEETVAGGFVIHRVRLKVPEGDEDREKMIELLGGEELELVAAVGPEGVILAAGAQSLDRVRRLLTKMDGRKKSEPRIASVLIDVGALAELGATLSPSEEQRAQAEKLVEAVAQTGQPALLEVSLSTIPQGFNLRFQMSEGFFKASSGMIRGELEPNLVPPLPLPSLEPMSPPAAKPPARPSRVPPALPEPRPFR